MSIETMIAEYLERHPDATEAEAYDKTADGAYDRMRDNLADHADALRRQKNRRCNNAGM